MWTKTFWKALTERVVSSFAGGVLAAIGLDTINPNALEFDTKTLLGIGAGTAIVSLLKGLAANAVSKQGPGLGSVETLT